MDPTENLREQLRLARNLMTDPASTIDADRLALLVMDLDEWLQQGGHLPRTWDTESSRELVL